MLPAATAAMRKSTPPTAPAAVHLSTLSATGPNPDTAEPVTTTQIPYLNPPTAPSLAQSRFVRPKVESPNAASKAWPKVSSSRGSASLAYLSFSPTVARV